MIKIFGLAFFVFFFGEIGHFGTFDKISQNILLADSCPLMEIVCDSSAKNCEGKNRTFVVLVTLGRSDEPPFYKWKVTNGTIIKGKGTPIISVQTNNPRKKMIVKVTIKKAIPKGCRDSTLLSIKGIN